ncbi:MAG TPA: 3,4-dihydroxy-2-butanone-4-phosphate synthase [Candidatus Aquilonibacter sp.]|nr:3,4-dihydroxy-2-butanone-4-phosphate synthase [Candidatus Aquilonibacter sp.]
MNERDAAFTSVKEAVEEIRQGRMIVLVDDEDRENEGDLAMAAEKVTPEAINFMAKFGRGLICLALTERRCETLGLQPITQRNTSMFGTPFCEPIDARVGTTTGTSASDRATTILTATDPKTHAEDLARPGHVYTLRARNGGVLVRAGQTEASVDLARIAGLDPSGVICEIMNDDGTMARTPQLREFCKTHGMKMLTVAALIHYRMQNERYVRRIAESVLPTRYGNFRMIAYASDVDSETHVALVRGDIATSQVTGLAGESAGSNEPALVRVHSQCLTGDVFGSVTCDCRQTIEKSLEAIAAADRGVFVYLHHTGRGFHIDQRTEENELLPRIQYHGRAEIQQDAGRQRLVQRESGIGVQILLDLGLRRVRVLTNHPRKLVALAGYGLEVVDQVPLKIDSSVRTHQVL